MESWRVEWDERAVKELQKLSAPIRKDVVRYLRERIALPDNPRRFGKPLLNEKRGLWRYRIGDVRLICSIQEYGHIIVVLKVGYRKDVYNS